MTLIERLARHLESGAIDELTLTSNGNQLAKHAAALADAGIRRINVSLDTLHAERFRAITRWGDIERVKAGIAEAKAAGIHVKINAVALRDVNEHELESLMIWAHGEGHDITFIETMPMGDTGADRSEQYLPLSVVRARLAEAHELTPLPLSTGGPARYFRVEDTGGRVGFITPLTHNFCEGCNRVRLTATGQLFMCLGQEDHADLRAVIRTDNTDPAAALDAALDEAIVRKPKGHDFLIARGGGSVAVPRHMSVTGG